MNDGTVWESKNANAPLLATGDEIRYEHLPSDIEAERQQALEQETATGTPSFDEWNRNRKEAEGKSISDILDSNYRGDEACYVVDQSRPGLVRFIGFRIVGDPKRQSCPAVSSERRSLIHGRVSFDPGDTTLENWTSESEPSGRIAPENSSCPEGYKPINHLSGVEGYVRHVDCIPVAMGQAH